MLLGFEHRYLEEEAVRPIFMQLPVACGFCSSYSGFKVLGFRVHRASGLNGRALLNTPQL